MTSAGVTYRELVVPAVRRETRVAAIGWVLALAAALTLYVLTLAPDLVWHDAGYYQWEAARLNLERPGEVVRIHPFFLLIAYALGRAGPWNYAYGASLASAVGTSIVVANVWLIVWLMLRRAGPATLAAVACMLAHTIWQQGVQPQTYGWSNAATTGVLAAAIGYAHTERPKWLLAAFFIGGVGLSIHLMSQLVLPVVGVWMLVRVLRGRTPAWTVAAAAGLWTLGAALFWYVAYLEYARTGDAAATVESALLGGWGRAVFNVGNVPRMLKTSVLMLALNFPTPAVLLAAVGVWRSRRLLEGTPAAALLLVTMGVYVLFAMRYDVPNQNFFFTPAYALAAVCMGLGLAAVPWRRPRLAAVVAILLAAGVAPMYVVIERVARAVEFPVGTGGKVHEIPYRDIYAYYFLPWQHAQTGARRFASEVLADEAQGGLPRGALMLPDTTTAPPLLCMHEVEGVRPDVQVVDPYSARFNESLAPLWQSQEDLLPSLREGGRRVFVASDDERYIPRWMRGRVALAPHGPVWEALPREADAPAGEEPAAPGARPSAEASP
jgi:hypothetical protein